MSTTWRFRLPQRADAERGGDADQELADFWTSYVDSGYRGLDFIWRHPLPSARMIRNIFRLPVVQAVPSQSSGGRAVRRVLSDRGPMGLPSRWFGTAVLELPKDPNDYVLGRRAQTLRRKIRSAERQGVRCELVTDFQERVALVTAANEAERRHPDPQYRLAAPDNWGLLEHDLWIKAVDSTGEVLLLAVAPIDGEFATLRYFRTLGAGPAHSDSRYLATYALVAELAQRGVRYLLDTEPPGAQTNGLRHFQRMMGFRYLRVRLGRGGERVNVLSVPVAFASLDPCLGLVFSLPIS